MVSPIFIVSCVSELVGMAILTVGIPNALSRALAARLSATWEGVSRTLNSVDLCGRVTKYRIKVYSPASTAEVMEDAFREAEAERPRAGFLSLPIDVMAAPVGCEVIASANPKLGLSGMPIHPMRLVVARQSILPPDTDNHKLFENVDARAIH